MVQDIQNAPSLSDFDDNPDALFAIASAPMERACPQCAPM
jgi:hypothetical protein